ncbi:hypothetical protein [Gordonia sp. (in: high G+C Gram-positive bacteria)]|uniref:hypothetical protein n=1 Tax=Gordonia sp. (in: high G+C Gram-positive bacteria) TaxID=84139 RepID=UPI00260D6AD3|nr:hypothetical protein [Gordonia sp. (in: high G+C Gram-positive bacteria)]
MAAPQFGLDEPLHLRISCGTHDDYEAHRTHRMTLNPDWTFAVPHDLEAESVAAVFGARLSCLNLPKVLDAVRLHVALNLRRAWYDMTPIRGEWEIGGNRQVQTTSRASAALAAAYIRSPRYAAGCHRVPAWQVLEIAEQIAWTDWWDRPDAPALLAPHPRIVECDGLETLWEAGIHPETVESIAPWFGAGPLPADVLIDGAYGRRSSRHLRNDQVELS